MRIPANSSKIFINELVTQINTFFKRISKQNHHFQLSEHYAIQKRNAQFGTKNKNGSKQSNEAKNQESMQKMKLMKKAFKRFKKTKLSDPNIIATVKQMSQKGKIKYMNELWQNLKQQQKIGFVQKEQGKMKILKKIKKTSQRSIRQNKKSENKQQ